MQKFTCRCCLATKDAFEFYKNPKKANGLESHCKACVLERKKKKYTSSSKTKKKNKRLRLLKKVNVLDVENCTFCEVLITRPKECDGSKTLKEFVRGVLWQVSTQL